MFLVVFVYLFVSNITQNVMNGFQLNFMEGSRVWYKEKK